MIRERTEERERRTLSKYAMLSVNAHRKHIEQECPLRTKFQRDRDRILHSSAFRRLKHKTQVYMAPKGDYYRTRMTHTLEVAQIARTVARALSLNEDLAEAVAYGHDLGHTPFGHIGEFALADACGHFKHNEQSVRLVSKIEKDGKGLNLTDAVLDGILHHTGEVLAKTLEGKIVKYADRIAYLCHDYDDAQASKMLTPQDLPEEVKKRFGTRHSQIITSMVSELVENSIDKNEIHMSEKGDETLLIFRKFMFDNVYLAPVLMPERRRGYHVVKELYGYFIKNPKDIPEKYRKIAEDDKRAALDFVSGLTDYYAIDLYRDIFIPRYWKAEHEKIKLST
ncbi:deoxyguanosinetriphosphate triphosphohydrolase [Dialister micraerophilus]|jgi:hypothetical protein|uniref:deoxyguanosinetriphosphate triphosphohydrolase n=1 Tax=Dialister micraerophilus TaxID=309120 RepID=UPI0023F10EF9|nr:deoxyguanosinetriphosphate triphosphohydrolase [Dialister micraerophilus]